MKKKNLKLSELKIKSFVTEKNDNDALTIKAGRAASGDVVIRTDPKNPIDTILCQPTPGTWCYICPVDDVPF